MQTVKNEPYLAPQGDVNFGHTAGCQRRGSMVTTQLLDKNWCKRWGFLEVRELRGILEQGNYSLRNREIENVS